MFEEDQRKEGRMRSNKTVLILRKRGHQNLLVSPRQSTRIVENLDTSERIAKRKRKRRRRRSKILILSPRRKMEIISLQRWPLM